MSSPSSQDLTPGFTISYLLMSQNGTPSTVFEAGSAIDFSWESTGDYFLLYEGNNTTPIFQGNGKSTTIAQGPSVDTTFTLEAQSGGDKLYKAVTAIIANPTLTPSSMTVTGAHTDKSDLIVVGNSTFNQLDVKGKVAFPDPDNPDFQISGYLQTNCAINVSGDTIVKGTLNADGATTQNITVNNSLTALQCAVTLFSDSVSVYNGNDAVTQTFTANCDGYLMAYILPDFNVWSKITLTLGKYSFAVSGGHIINAYGKDVTSNSLLLPVANGTSLTYATSYKPSRPLAFTLLWYPIGKSASEKDTFAVRDTRPEELPAPVPDMAAIQAAREAAWVETANAFIQNVERASNKEIGEDMKRSLNEKLMALRQAGLSAANRLPNRL